MEKPEDILTDFSTVLPLPVSLHHLQSVAVNCKNVGLDQISNTSTVRRGKMCMSLLPSSGFLLCITRYMLQVAVAVIAAQPVLSCERKACMFEVNAWYLRNNPISAARKLRVCRL